MNLSHLFTSPPFHPHVCLAILPLPHNHHRKSRDSSMRALELCNLGRQLHADPSSHGRPVDDVPIHQRNIGL